MPKYLQLLQRLEVFLILVVVVHFLLDETPQEEDASEMLSIEPQVQQQQPQLERLTKSL